MKGSTITMIAFAIIATNSLRVHAAAPSLGAADNFAVLAGSTITNTGLTVVVTGDLGVNSGTPPTGFPPGTVTPPGTIHVGDVSTAQAEADTLTAYNTLKNTAFTTNLTGQNLGGLTLGAGVYRFDAAAQLTGALILDGSGNPNSDFIIQTGSTFITASNAIVTLTNGAKASHVFWQVGSSATLGTGTTFQGNLLAFQSITFDNGTTLLDGRALAINGAVTLDTNTIALPSDPVSSVPEPSQTLVVGFGLLTIAGLLFRARRRSNTRVDKYSV